MRRANVVKTHLLQAYRKKNRKLYEKENKILLLLLLLLSNTAVTEEKKKGTKLHWMNQISHYDPSHYTNEPKWLDL